jgi:DNA-binding MarR family transcriptional regulator
MAIESDRGSTNRAETGPVIDAMVQLSFAVLDVLGRSAADHDLSVTQLRLLGILRDRTPTMAALADFLRLDRSSVSGLIDRAERRGLVARRTSTDDARVTIVDLTPAGVELGVALSATITARMAALLSELPDAENDAMVRIAESVTGNPIR